MNSLNISKIKMKNLLGLIENPTIEDLLFEIVYFLYNENRKDGIFTLKEASLKTDIRISDELINDIEKLIDLQYIEKEKANNKFKIIKHLWQ